LVYPAALEDLLLQLAEHSLYARLDEVRQGFLTLAGGHRVGIVGRAVTEGNEIGTVRDVSGLNIRRARACKGTASRVLAGLPNPEPISILVASPPRAGKTTLIRDLTRHWSDAGHISVIIDERSEIAGMNRGVAAYDVGQHSDVLDGWPKAAGILAALRSLSPEIVVVDELAWPADFDAVQKARWSGVHIVASVHLGQANELRQNRSVKTLWEGGVFDALVWLSRQNGPGTIEGIQMWREEFSSETVHV
jgi:stage III sporulation protein AA